MTTYAAPDALSVACGYCGAQPGIGCMAFRAWARKPHAARVELAFAVAAHADPALDEHFPQTGPCGVCAVPGMPQRHRVVDAIAGRLEAGEDAAEVAEDYLVAVEAVQAVAQWMTRWPEVW